MMPIPESLMSPDCAPPFIITNNNNQTLSQKPKPVTSGKNQPSKLSMLQRPSSSPASMRSQKVVKKSADKSPLSPKKKVADADKVERVQKASKQIEKESEEVDNASQKIALDNGEKSVPPQQKQQKVIENREIENSATVIQKLWRGYCTRKKFTNKISDALHQKRTQDYISKLTKDMEKTKQALENERKIQQLQMQAINALWKKVSHMQISENPLKDISNNNLNSNELIQDLVKTCSVLTTQVYIENFKHQSIVFKFIFTFRCNNYKTQCKRF
jgi:centrosomal protein CEP97